MEAGMKGEASPISGREAESEERKEGGGIGVFVAGQPWPMGKKKGKS